jgi:hypothetical protein
LLGRGFDGFVGRWAARIVPILHERIAAIFAKLPELLSKPEA